jgi:hypothetical protein
MGHLAYYKPADMLVTVSDCVTASSGGPKFQHGGSD